MDTHQKRLARRNLRNGFKSGICLGVGLTLSLGSVALAAEPYVGLKAAIAAKLPELEALYQDLHQHPELSLQEVRSASILAAEAKKAGFEVTEKVGGTGVVAVLKNGKGPTVLLRADMDGLPVLEQTGLAYASKAKSVSPTGDTVSVMHACGHDIHMAVWVGTLQQLARTRSKWSGTVVMVAQPAEEIVLGARAMLRDGLYQRFPRPDYNLALHDTNALAAGQVGIVKGFALAAADTVDIEVRGIGGHGAGPHATKDPVVLASMIVVALQTLVSRSVNPLEPAVVTVGSIHGGTKHNIIGTSVKLQLTVRSTSEATRTVLLEGIDRIAKNEARAFGLPEDLLPSVKVSEERVPVTLNDADLMDRLVPGLKQQLGKDRVVNGAPIMGSEDFSEYARVDPKIPSVMFWLGAVDPELYAKTADKSQLPSLHSGFWAPKPGPTLATGVELMTTSALELLAKK